MKRLKYILLNVKSNRMLDNRQILFTAFVILVLSGAILLVQSVIPDSSMGSRASYNTSIGVIKIGILLPDTPTNLTSYHVTPQPNDTAYYSVTNLEETRPNVTSEIDAPHVARTALKDYGGLPDEAILTYNETEYLEEKEFSEAPFIPNRVVARYPISTNVQFGRKLNGIPVTGEGGFINIDLGTDGELLYLNKVWRTVEPAGTEKVIPVSKAIEKLSRSEVLDPLKCICDITVDRIYIAYWEKGAGVPQEYLDPVWVFSGTTASGEVINYKVYARDDGDSPVTPVSRLANINTNATSAYLP